MFNETHLNRFVEVSSYTDPVDIKKLRFVFSAIAGYCEDDGRTAEGLSILEVACGIGGVTLPLATLGGRVRALDIDGDDVAELEMRAQALGIDNIEVTVEDALTYDDEVRYDVVVASEVFEHLVEPEKLVEAIARYVAPGGLLLVTTPNGYGPWEMWNAFKLLPRRWNWLRRLVGKPRHDGAGREHEQRYTHARLKKLFAAGGFRPTMFSNSDFIFTLFRPLRRSRFFGTIDTRLGDVVPHWMASGWYMAFRQNNGGPSQ